MGGVVWSFEGATLVGEIAGPAFRVMGQEVPRQIICPNKSDSPTCRRATRATGAPASKVSSTIRRFSSTDRRRLASRLGV